MHYIIHQKNPLYKVLFFFTIIFLTFFGNNLDAQTKPITTDSRIKVFVYNEYEVYPLFFHHNYISHLDFPRDEKIMSISLGESTNWRIDIANGGTRLYIQPLARGINTNMNIMTTKRNYELDIYSYENINSYGLDIAYSVRFYYPHNKDDKSINELIDNLFHETEQEKMHNYQQYQNPASPENIHQVLQNIKQNSKLNIHYQFSGNYEYEPQEVFDDHKMTYIVMPSKNNMPEDVGSLDENNNFHHISAIINDNVLIINQRAKQIMLKYPNDEYLILYNNANIN